MYVWTAKENYIYFFTETFNIIRNSNNKLKIVAFET